MSSQPFAGNGVLSVGKIEIWPAVPADNSHAHWEIVAFAQTRPVTLLLDKLKFGGNAVKQQFNAWFLNVKPHCLIGSAVLFSVIYVSILWNSSIYFFAG